MVSMYFNPPDRSAVLCVDEKGPMQALRWGMFRSVPDLIAPYMASRNAGPQPLARHKSAESIVERVARGRL